jgi:hypothetical protein
MLDKPTWIDSTLGADNYLGFVLVFGAMFLIAIIAHGWWWAVAVYLDAKNRNLKNKFGWAFLSLFLNTWGAQLYTSFTKRPQTALSLSPLGVFGGDRLEKFKSKKWIFLIIVLLSLFWVYQLFNYIKGGQNIANIADKNSGIEFLLAPILIVYLIFSYYKRGKINPLDKPLWGMKMTSEGPVDESLTKHKKWVTILSTFISLMILAFLVMLGISLVKSL